MKKQDLYNLIDARYKEKCAELNNAYEEKAENLAQNVINHYHDQLTELSDAFENVRDLFTNSERVLEGITGNYGVVRDIRNLVLQGSLYNRIQKALVNELKSLNREWYSPLDEMPEIETLKKYYNGKIHLKYIKEKEKLDTLRTELKQIVKTSSTAKAAAKKLQDLGLDLSDLEKHSEDNLPMVLKTSVDVCLFNKQGCN